MEIHSDPAEERVRDAATVVLLRDGPEGPEVFLIERHGRSDVLGGAHVFPGGKIDASDHAADLLAHLDAPAAALQASLAEEALTPAAGAAVYVGAIRELLEETGLLLARGATSDTAGSAWHRARSGAPFAAIVHAMDLTLSASALQPWSRWITPRVGAVSRKRFDTRFFLARLPTGQSPCHDDHEATGSLWITPRAALERYWDRGMQLAPPQVLSLAHLARHATAESALAEAQARPPVLVEPQSLEIGGERVMCYPGDPAHACSGPRLPGPTRLHMRGGRFEPTDGFEDFFR